MEGACFTDIASCCLLANKLGDVPTLSDCHGPAVADWYQQHTTTHLSVSQRGDLGNNYRSYW